LFARSGRLAVLIHNTMRTILLTSLLGACTSRAGSPDPVPARPMPTATVADVGNPDVPSTAAACVTRYSYPSLGLVVGCTTEHVGGDPLHWVTSCALPADRSGPESHNAVVPPDRYEATADANGHLLHEVIDDMPTIPYGYHAPHDVVYTYDDQHRLAELVQRDTSGAVIFDLVVGARDGDGNPLAITSTQIPFAPEGPPHPATGQTARTFSYDALGRLVADTATWGDGVTYWNETISYDDADLRRDASVVVDLTSEFHDGGGPGLNLTHDFFDADGNLLEEDHTVAGDSAPSVFVDRYDDLARLTQTITTQLDSFVYTIDYIYECP
jgi:YD repeat-containing protein